MVYMGSKNKYAKYIVPILQKFINENNITTYVEPFVGGANIIDKIQCEKKIGSDKNDTLIALLQLAQTEPEKILDTYSKELFEKGKTYIKDGIKPEDMSLAEIGAIAYFASFGAKGFKGGYVNPIYNNGKRNVFYERRNNLIKQAPMLKDIEFLACEYQNNPYLQNCENLLIYCDPPYQNTEHYEYKNVKKFDYNEFWDWIRKLSEKNIVIVSEQIAPDDFEVLWEQQVKRCIGEDHNYRAVEKLFKWKGEIYGS